MSATEPLASELVDRSLVMVPAHLCRKCGTELRARPPLATEVTRSRADRAVVCPNPTCRSLLWLWTTSTGA